MKTPNSIDVMLGRRVRMRRVQLGISQTVLADKIGVTFQQVQKYEKGTNRISCSRLFEIAAVLNRPIGYFFAEPHASDREARLVDKVRTGEVKEGLRLIKAFFEIDRPVLRRKAISLLESFTETKSKTR